MNPSFWRRGAVVSALMLLMGGGPVKAQRAMQDVDASGLSSHVSGLPSAGAADVHEPVCGIEPGGSLRAGHWSQPMAFDRPSDVLTSALWVQAQWACRPGWKASVEAVAASEDVLRGTRRSGRLREAWVDWHDGAWSARVGRQLIVWGRADRFNPTDNLTPRDYTRLTPEDTDQRDGVDAARITRRFDDLALTGVLMMPRFRANGIPIELPPGVNRRELGASGPQAALKLDRSGGETDWSVSWLHGFDLMPSYALAMSPTAPPTLLLRHPRVQVLGADAATVAGRYGLRAEASYTWIDRDGTRDAFTRKPVFYAVAGGDRSFDGDLNANLQLFWRHVVDHRDAADFPDPARRAMLTQAMASWSQTRRDQFGLTFRLADRWLHDTVEAEFAGAVSFTGHEFALRPRLVWRASDRVKLTLGADRYGGSRDTFFGQIRDLSNVFLEGQLGF